jgi:hypothetical protein
MDAFVHARISQPFQTTFTLASMARRVIASSPPFRAMLPFESRIARKGARPIGRAPEKRPPVEGPPGRKIFLRRNPRDRLDKYDICKIVHD